MSVGNESWVDRLDLEEGDSFENLDPVDQVDVVSDAFERQWQNGTRQAVECFLEGAPVTEGILDRLHQELIEQEIELRSDAGETIACHDYFERMPDQALFTARYLVRHQLDLQLEPPLKKCGAYWLLELVGRGNFGVVYRAYDQELDRFVAIKLPMTGLGDEESVRRFQREAKNAGRLAHPGIVPIYFVKQDDDGRPFIVSEFVDGTTLDTFVADKGRRNARTAASLVAQVAESVDYAHDQGIVHRDLKPSNVILEARKIGDSTQDGTPDDSLRPRVLDFGLARRRDGDASRSIQGAVVGTPAYMSPEQARGDARVDQRADVYSLGAILYELLLGQRCFPGETFSAVLLQVIGEEPELPPDKVVSVPKDLMTICMKCLSKEPADRYARASDLADDLRRWLRHEEIKARPLSRPVKTVRWVRRNVVMSAGITTAIVLTSIIMLLAVNGQRESNYREIISSLEIALPEELERKIEETRRFLETVPGLPNAIVRYLKNSSPKLATDLRFRIVLSDQLPLHAKRFYDETNLDQIPIEELAILASYLTDAACREELKERVRISLASNGDGLHETVCLIVLEADWPGFKALAPQIVDALVQSPDPSAYARALRPISAELLPLCRDPFTDSAQAETVARIVVELAADRPGELVWFLERSVGPTTRVLFPPLWTPQNLLLVKGRADVLSRRPRWHTASPQERLDQDGRFEHDVQRHVNLALCHGFARDDETLRVLVDLLKSDEDPRPRTHFIRRAKDFIPSTTLSQHIAWKKGDERDDVADDLLYCLILAISQYEQKDLADHETLINRLREVYLWHPDSGVHSAAGYCLRKLGDNLAELHLQRSHLEDFRADRDWYHTSFGTCMIVIRAGDYPLWYFPDLMRPQIGTVRHISIQRGFALAATEMTQREYARLTGNPASESEYPQEFNAVLPVTPDDVAASDRLSLIDTCRLANVQENLADDCFDPNPAEGVAAICDPRKSGFRFPVAHEWLVCCTAGALTPRYFGSDRTDGAGFIGDAPTESYHSVFHFFPNRLGFFDMTDNLHDITLTKFDGDRELLLGAAAGDVVLRAGDNLTYHGGRNWLPNGAKMTLYAGGAYLGSPILRTCLRLTQTLPNDTFSEKED